MFFKKNKFYTLNDIKKRITLIPLFFIGFFTVASIVVSGYFLKTKLAEDIYNVEKQNNIVIQEELKDFTLSIEKNLALKYENVQNDLKESNYELIGFINAKKGSQSFVLQDLYSYIHYLENKKNISLLLFDKEKYSLLYGEEILKTIKDEYFKNKSSFTFSKDFFKQTLKNKKKDILIYENKEHLLLSSFSSVNSLSWELAFFSPLLDKRMQFLKIFEKSIYKRSKKIEGHFVLLNHNKKSVYNYYNQNKEILIKNIYDFTYDKNNVHLFEAYSLSLLLKKEYLPSSLFLLKEKFYNSLSYAGIVIFIITLLLFLFTIFFTRFLSRVFYLYDLRSKGKTNLYKQLKDRYALAIIASNDSLCDIDLEKNIIFFSKKWEDTFFYDKNKINSIDAWHELIHEEDKEVVKQLFTEHLEGKNKKFVVEYRIKHKDGMYKWVLARGEIFKNKKNKNIRMLMTLMDIDERKNLFKELSNVERLVESGRIVIFRCSNDNKFLLKTISSSISSYGYDKKDFIEHKIKYFDFIFEEDLMDFKASLKDAIVRNLSAFSTIYRVKEKSGSIKWVFSRIVLIKDHLNTVTEFYGYINDITQLKLNEKELKEKIKKEVDKNIEKDRLLVHQNKLASMGKMLGNIAPQWRQPLNNISLLIYFVRDHYFKKEFTKKELNENIDHIKFQLDFMSNTIDDFRNFYLPTKSKNSFWIQESIQTAYKIVKSEFDSSNTKLIFNTFDIEVNTYKNEFQQVIVNILSNSHDAAIEKLKNETFSPFVKINIEEMKENIKVEIQNNCGSASTEVIKRMFEPYFTTKFESQGTGIGLYMCKVIIEKNIKGSIDAFNTQDGMKFIIVLPK